MICSATNTPHFLFMQMSNLCFFKFLCRNVDFHPGEDIASVIRWLSSLKMKQDSTRNTSYTVDCEDYVHVVKFNPFDSGDSCSLLFTVATITWLLGLADFRLVCVTVFVRCPWNWLCQNHYCRKTGHFPVSSSPCGKQRRILLVYYTNKTRILVLQENINIYTKYTLICLC